MEKTKRFILGIFLVVLFNFPVKIYANFSPSNNVYTQVQTVPQSIRDADFQRQIDAAINTLQSQDLVNSFKNENNTSITPLSRAIYTSETVAIKYKPLGGYAENSFREATNSQQVEAFGGLTAHLVLPFQGAFHSLYLINL